MRSFSCRICDKPNISVMYYNVSPHEIAKLKTRHGVRPTHKSVSYHNKAPRCTVLTRAGHQCLRRTAVTDHGINYCCIYRSHQPDTNVPFAPRKWPISLEHCYGPDNRRIRPRFHHQDDIGADTNDKLARLRRQNLREVGDAGDRLLREEGEEERSEWPIRLCGVLVNVATVYVLHLTVECIVLYLLAGFHYLYSFGPIPLLYEDNLGSSLHRIQENVGFARVEAREGQGLALIVAATDG
jgi:hypothetical protein